jgi:hypothetical protein
VNVIQVVGDPLEGDGIVGNIIVSNLDTSSRSIRVLKVLHQRVSSMKSEDYMALLI